MQNIVNIHLISDFTCDTLLNISGIISSQFPNVKINRIFWPFVRYEDQVADIIKSLKEKPGIILFSILEDAIEDEISEAVKDMPACKIIPVIDYAISEVASFLREKPNKIKRKSNFNDEYIRKIEAIRYTINHDDGRMSQEYGDADIILIGVSRTSKSPTSIYLANRGYKVANIPFVSEELMPEELKEFAKQNKPVIIGLTVEPERLVYLRDSRMRTDGIEGFQMAYNDISSVIEELRDFRRYCGKLGCHTLDVTSKSVEEAVVHILRHHNNIKSLDEKQS